MTQNEDVGAGPGGEGEVHRLQFFPLVYIPEHTGLCRLLPNFPAKAEISPARQQPTLFELFLFYDEFWDDRAIFS